MAGGIHKPAARLSSLSERSLKASKKLDPAPLLARIRLSDRLTITIKAKLQTIPKTGSTARESRGGVHARQVVVGDTGRGPDPGGRPARPFNQASGRLHLPDLPLQGPKGNTNNRPPFLPAKSHPTIPRPRHPRLPGQHHSRQ